MASKIEKETEQGPSADKEVLQLSDDQQVPDG